MTTSQGPDAKPAVEPLSGNVLPDIVPSALLLRRGLGVLRAYRLRALRKTPELAPAIEACIVAVTLVLAVRKLDQAQMVALLTDGPDDSPAVKPDDLAVTTEGPASGAAAPETTRIGSAFAVTEYQFAATRPLEPEAPIGHAETPSGFAATVQQTMRLPLRPR